ncbi:MAG: 2-oxoacid:acceptor oxidoreductase family protein [archaeon]
MRWNIVCGGPAGQGPNFIANLISRGLMDSGFYVFASREYESRIRGGHNYNLITFSDEPIYSNSPDIDILVALDDLSESTHRNELKKNAIIIKESKNVTAAGHVFKVLGIEFSILNAELKKLGKYSENLEEAKTGYGSEKRSLKLPKIRKAHNFRLMDGNDAIAQGATESGLDFYYVYPITPATGVLFSLAKNEAVSNYVTVQLEGEIAVVNAAIGSAITGAKTMIGTSGAGLDLMSESLSLAGGAQVPLVIYMGQRPGPATGAATYTAQEDLSMVRHTGHGEFVRVIAAPGDPMEAMEKTSELFYLTQKYRIPGILLGDKHLADSYYPLSGKAKITKSKKTISWPSRFSSYTTNNKVIADSSAKNVKEYTDRRYERYASLSNEINRMTPYKIHGKQASKNLVIGWGSTKGAIVDAISGLDCKFIQMIYLEPFSSNIIKELKKAKNLIIVENNKTSLLSSLIAEKTGIFIEDKNKILKYDGRPFMFEPLRDEIKKRLK